MAKNRKTAILALAVLLLAAVGGTVAFLATGTPAVKNTFTPSQVTTKVTESFDGETKSNVNATNTGNIPAYLRIRLVTYRVNEAGLRIGGTAVIPEFTPGTGWVKYGDHYYYTLPVAPGQQPATALIGQIKLVDYDDLDGGRQVIEVMAEAIQSDGVNENGVKAVVLAWGVDPEQLG